MKPFYAIVFAKDYNEHQAYLMMKSDDFRYNTAEYVLVTRGTYKKGLFHGINKTTYEIASDWSARPMSQQEKSWAA